MDDINYLIIVQYRARSRYDDQIGKRYHFPRKYFNQLTQPGIQFIYFEPKKASGEYFGYGEIGAVTPDPENSDQFFAEVLNYHEFLKPVHGFDAEGRSLEAGPYYNPQNAVRRTSADIFAEICRLGGIDLGELGTEAESSDSEDPIVDPFDPTKIKVDREPMSVFQVLRKIELGEIILHPEFQRNVVWDPVRRSRLIESTLLRIPLPAFYFDGIDANRWSVVDGLQRLSTLRDFISLESSFALTGMEYLIGIEGKRFKELPRGMQRDIEETQVTLFIIRPETPAGVKFTIFYRINTGGLVLTAQEIRHALFQGEATNLLRRLAEKNEFITATDGGVNDIRMDARECVLRYLAFRLHPYQSYSKGDLNRFLSDTMKEINELPSGDLSELEQSFVDAMDRAYDVLGGVAFRKFTPDSNRRGPINKALFESWANVLQGYDRTALVRGRERIISNLAARFEGDVDYLKSLSSGTGSPRAVQMRFQRAHEVIRDAIG